MSVDKIVAVSFVVLVIFFFRHRPSVFGSLNHRWIFTDKRTRHTRTSSRAFFAIKNIFQKFWFGPRHAHTRHLNAERRSNLLESISRQDALFLFSHSRQLALNILIETFIELKPEMPEMPLTSFFLSSSLHCTYLVGLIKSSSFTQRHFNCNWTTAIISRRLSIERNLIWTNYRTQPIVIKSLNWIKLENDFICVVCWPVPSNLSCFDRITNWPWFYISSQYAAARYSSE